MNPIQLAAQMMGNRKISRRATAKSNDNTVFLWELSDGATLEVIRGKEGFKSVTEKHTGFEALMDFYQRAHARVFSADLRHSA